MAFLWSGFLIGFVGSAHCMGMCGPIAMSLPTKNNTYISALVYNGARLLSYAVLGAIMALIGKGLFLADVQKWFSVGVGVIIIMATLLSKNLETIISTSKFLKKPYAFIQKSLIKAYNKKGYSSSFWIGYLNGLIPCGLVYFAIVGAITSKSFFEGPLYMLAFGLGTLPMMLVLSIFGPKINMKWRKNIRKLYPVFMIIMGLIFIYRGLFFNVPLDFKFWESLKNPIMCH